ncbi:MAG TPA: hypothetical protein VF713_04225, partial [Thermoanaerobaculia bacterium]
MLPSAFTVDPSAFGIGGQPLTVRVTVADDTSATLVASDQRLSLRTYTPGRVIHDYIENLGNWLDDLIASKACVHDEADVLLLRRSANGQRWLTFVTRDQEVWRGDAIEISDAPDVNVSYTLSEAEEQMADLAATHRRFMALAGMVFRPRERREPVLLRVKVSRDELWFLRFPLGAYAKLKLRGFESYIACQTIVTTRSISEVASRQREAEAEWMDTRKFFESTYIILNTYAAHADSAGA